MGAHHSPTLAEACQKSWNVKIWGSVRVAGDSGVVYHVQQSGPVSALQTESQKLSFGDEVGIEHPTKPECKIDFGDAQLARHFAEVCLSHQRVESDKKPPRRSVERNRTTLHLAVCRTS